MYVKGIYSFNTANPRPLFRLFYSHFEHGIQFLQQINVEKCSSVLGFEITTS